jgi:hypothetical protein
MPSLKAPKSRPTLARQRMAPQSGVSRLSLSEVSRLYAAYAPLQLAMQERIPRHSLIGVREVDQLAHP